VILDRKKTSQLEKKINSIEKKFKKVSASKKQDGINIKRQQLQK